MGFIKKRVHDVHDVHDYSPIKPVEEVSGEKQEDIGMSQYKGYSPITRFAQDKSEKIFSGLTLKLLAIFVIVVAIVLVILFFNKERVVGVGIGDKSLDMKIKNARLEGDSAKINLEIDPKEEEIVGIKFIFETKEGIEEFTQNISINDSSEMEFTFKLLTDDLNSVKKISVVPILGILNQENNEEKEEVFGEVKDTYIPKPRDIQEVYTENSLQNTTNLENKYIETNNQANGSDLSSSGNVSGELVPSVTSLKNTTGIINQTTTMNYTNVTNNASLVNSPVIINNTTILNNDFLNISNETREVLTNTTTNTSTTVVYSNFTYPVPVNTIDYKKICEDKEGIWVETYYSSSGAAYCRLPIITNTLVK